MGYKYQRARTSRVGLVLENQDALCLSRGYLGRHRRQHTWSIPLAHQRGLQLSPAAIRIGPASRNGTPAGHPTISPLKNCRDMGV
jgi:hypothetical protein